MRQIVLAVAALACAIPAHAARTAYPVSAEAGVLTSTQPGGSAY